MSSASKALELLTHFSLSQPEIGLSQLCRMARRDKATTYRHLQALEAASFVEQNPKTREYRLGPALLHLAQLREATVPRKQGAHTALQDLADATGETAHASVLTGTVLYGLLSCDSARHSTRAVIDIVTFPLHATASGLCALAFGPETLFEIACADLARFTERTPTQSQALAPLIEAARLSGFASADQIYETDIHGIAAPLFDQTGLFAGAVAVASVASRFTPALEQITKAQLAVASRTITHNWGGVVPPEVEAAWARSLTPESTLEPTS